MVHVAVGEVINDGQSKSRENSRRHLVGFS